MDPAMAHPKLDSFRSAAVAGMALAAVAFCSQLFIVGFIAGVDKGRWSAEVASAAYFSGLYFLVACPMWWWAISGIRPHRFLRIHATLLAGLGIPVLVTVIVLLFGLDSDADWFSLPNDGRRRLNPGIVHMIAAGICGFLLTRSARHSDGTGAAAQATADFQTDPASARVDRRADEGPSNMRMHLTEPRPS
jgi:hypothetical protein